MREKVETVTDRVFEIRFNGETLLCKNGEPLAVCLYRNGVKGFNLSSKHQRRRSFTNLDWWMPERLQCERDPFFNPFGRIDEEGLSFNTPRTGASHRLLTRTMKGLIDSEFPHRAMIRNGLSWKLTSTFLRKSLPHPTPREVNVQRIKAVVVETDVLVVGSGISGLSFALKMKELGSNVALIDGDHVSGGHALYDKSNIRIFGKTTRDHVEDLLGKASDEKVPLFADVVLDGFFDEGALGIRLGGLRPDAPVLFKAKFFALATGLRDLPCLFENNDLPGHMVASAALKLVNYYGVKPGTKGVVIGESEYAVRTALQLKKAGTSVSLIMRNGDAARARRQYLEALQEEDVEVVSGVKFITAEGERKVESVTIDGRRIPADFIVSAGSWSPTLELFGQVGIPVGYNHWMSCLVPMHGWYGETANPSVFVIGRSAGILDEYASSTLAQASAYYVARRLDLRVDEDEMKSRLRDARNAFNKGYAENCDAYSRLIHCYETGQLLSEAGHNPICGEDARKIFVCFCEDTTLKDIYRGVKAHGFEDIELLKRYTGIGTGKCQGKICLSNAMLAMSELIQKPPSAIGTFRQRPFVVSTSLESLAAL